MIGGIILAALGLLRSCFEPKPYAYTPPKVVSRTEPNSISQTAVPPSEDTGTIGDINIKITITIVPTNPPGESMASEPIKGTVRDANHKEHKVVIYVRVGDKWYVQPYAASPYTNIGEDGKWESETHGGMEFAALLVKSSYKPSATLGSLPAVGGDVLDISKASHPVISITNIPPAGFVPNQMEDIAGEVKGLEGSACTNYAVVIYAYAENSPGRSPWSVQPTYDSPLTSIGSDGRWNNRIHRGSKYAAILVKKPYEPNRVLDALPAKSGNILDITIVEGTKAK